MGEWKLCRQRFVAILLSVNFEKCLLTTFLSIRFAVQFIMKCDDDTFVNVPNLLHVLLGGTVPVYIATLMQYDVHKVHVKPFVNRLHYSMVKKLLMGHRFCHTKPIVNASSKWYLRILFHSIETKRFHFHPSTGIRRTTCTTRKHIRTIYPARDTLCQPMWPIDSTKRL